MLCSRNGRLFICDVRFVFTLPKYGATKGDIRTCKQDRLCFLYIHIYILDPPIRTNFRRHRYETVLIADSARHFLYPPWSLILGPVCWYSFRDSPWVHSRILPRVETF